MPKHLLLATHLLYLRYVLRHKWFVFWAGLELGVPVWQLIIHDWHKFLPDEWFAYARNFYGTPAQKEDPGTREGFSRAWLKHQNRAPHHWQYWIRLEDSGQEVVMKMPDRYKREMLADWIGTGMAITGSNNVLTWYTNTRSGRKLHAGTQLWVENQIGYVEEATE